MTEKELRRLNRQDLLQLLLLQTREMETLQAEATDLHRQCDTLADSNERLKAKLNQKDATIQHLVSRLDAKDETIRQLKDQVVSTVDEQAITQIAIRTTREYLQGRKA